MARPIKFDESGDSADLQALFDSIAAAHAPQPAVVADADASGDSPELQALFDSVAAQVEAATPVSQDQTAVPGADGAGTQEEVVFNRLGHLARQLHDSLRELGLDKSLEATARQIPDAQGRLHYIAQMTEQAALKVLNACDVAKPTQDELAALVKSLGERWEKMFANQLSVEEFKQLAAETRSFFAGAPEKIGLVNSQLNDIMLAQDFQDLTGQVIKKVVAIVQNVEAQLLQLLIETMPAEKRAATQEGLMNGPVIDAAGRNDVVTNQQQVDDLLESLGF